MSLVPVPAGECPACGEVTEVLMVWQPALFFHGGHGATVRTETRHCFACGWWLDAGRAEVRP